MRDRWTRGEPVVLREVWRGRVWAARPATVVEDTPAHRMFYVAPGAPLMLPVDREGRDLRLPTDHWVLVERNRTPRPVLSFSWPDRAYAVLAYWQPSGHFAGFYVNLQSPLRPTPAGFDYVDHLLDVLIPADLDTWRWKDEDELEEAVRLGIFSAGDAGRFREDGLRAVGHVRSGRPPFDRDWSGWRPDPTWSPPELPPGWESLPPLDS